MRRRAWEGEGMRLGTSSQAATVIPAKAGIQTG